MRRLVRVSDGTRTHDRLDHNQELYQLSYAHRGGLESSSAERVWSLTVPSQNAAVGGAPSEQADDGAGLIPRGTLGPGDRRLGRSPGEPQGQRRRVVSLLADLESRQGGVEAGEQLLGGERAAVGHRSR